MSVKYLHIVSFNIPYPADYGGIIDIYYKLKALKKVGVNIILHCYVYGRQPAKELEDICFKVYYYSRDSGLKYFLSSNPYIVATRNAKSMPENLLGDPFPVLFEGLHGTSMIERCAQAKKKILVRAHNIEHHYYGFLSKSESNLFRKLFFRSESRKLKRYEHVLSMADHVLGIAKHETAYFERSYQNAVFIPAFHRFDEVTSIPGTGEYILFHGNLGVPENSEVFLFLLRTVLSKISYPVIVAGKNPSERFRRKLSRHTQINLIANPDDEQMEELIRNAQLNLLYTSQSTGIKLKLLHALFAGRHCLVNQLMVEGSGLDHLCSMVEDHKDLPGKIEELMKAPFGDNQIRARKKALQDHTNRAGAEKILRLIS
ncbi:MAG: glycosyltransferase family 1 protein [Bacteroidales bacterium]|nr:glycosyltransferase family 1 protein [Bacteroidales bacterium]